MTLKSKGGFNVKVRPHLQLFCRSQHPSSARLEEVRDEMLNLSGSGMCVMEMSHRSKVFIKIAEEAEADLRELMNIPDNYKVLFIQGGATLQFAMIPMNLMKNGVADYIVTAIGPIKPMPKPRSSEKLIWLLPAKIRTTVTFLMSLICQYLKTPIMFTFAKTRPSTVLLIKNSPIPREKHWCPTKARCSSPNQ